MRSGHARSQPCSRAQPEMRLPEGFQNTLVHSPPVSYSPLLDVLFHFWNLPFYFIFFILLALLFSTYFSSRTVYSNTSFKRQFCWSSQWIILARREGNWGNCCRCWGERSQFLSPSWRPLIEGIRGTVFYFLLFYFFSFFQVKKERVLLQDDLQLIFRNYLFFHLSSSVPLYAHENIFINFFVFLHTTVDSWIWTMVPLNGLQDVLTEWLQGRLCGSWCSWRPQIARQEQKLLGRRGQLHGSLFISSLDAWKTA